MYEKGKGVALDDRQAVYWYRKAADQGDADAQYNLGLMYGKGKGVAKDYKQAVYWYRKAADQGQFASAQTNLGNGIILEKALPRIIDRQFIGSEKQQTKGMGAQFNLGEMYYFGKGVALDYRQAVYWYRKAADQGYANGQSNLGFMYGNGKGVALDDKQAVYWYRKAADQGYARAQANLGFMYEKGKGVALDIDRQFIGTEKQQTKGMRMLNII